MNPRPQEPAGREKLPIEHLSLKQRIALRAAPPSVSSEVRVIREDLGYTQREFAQRLGVSYQYLNDIELGRRKLSFDVCDKLALCTGSGALYWAQRQFDVDFWRHSQS